jgi:hypothetical protein
MLMSHPLTYQCAASRSRSGIARWRPVLRLGRWLAAGALVAALAVLPRLEEWASRRQLRRDSARSLVAAKRALARAAPTPAAPPPGIRGTRALVPMLVSEAIGRGGTVLSVEDGSWILIRVEPSSNPKASLAVAVDSGGQWFVSDEHDHLPDRFADYRTVYTQWWRQREAARTGQPHPWPEGAEKEGMLRGINPQLSDIEGSATLAEARQKLQRLGFRPAPP